MPPSDRLPPRFVPTLTEVVQVPERPPASQAGGTWAALRATPRRCAGCADRPPGVHCATARNSANVGPRSVG